MKIWETLYEDKKYGKERKSSFNYFTRYLKQEHPRKITLLYDEICKETSDKNNRLCPIECSDYCIEKNHDYCPENFKPKKPIKIETLYDYSRKWKWKKRAVEYDKYLLKLHLHNKEMEVMDWESKQLKFAKNRCNFHNDSLKNLHDKNDNNFFDDFSIDDKIKLEKINQEAYDKSIDDVYKLLYGGVIKQENHNTGEMEFNQNIRESKSIKELEVEYEDYYNELQSELEGNQKENNHNNIDE